MGATATGTAALPEALEGNLVINGVTVPLFATSAAGISKTINRFTGLTGVTASENEGALVLTADEEVMRVDGDTHVMHALSLPGGVIVAPPPDEPASIPPEGPADPLAAPPPETPPPAAVPPAPTA